MRGVYTVGISVAMTAGSGSKTLTSGGPDTLPAVCRSSRCGRYGRPGRENRCRVVCRRAALCLPFPPASVVLALVSAALRPRAFLVLLPAMPSWSTPGPRAGSGVPVAVDTTVDNPCPGRCSPGRDRVNGSRKSRLFPGVFEGGILQSL